MNRVRYDLGDPRRRGIAVPPMPAPSYVEQIQHSSMGEAPLPPPMGEEGVWTTPGCDQQRMQLAGGLLNSLLVDPMIEPFERLYRRLPEEAMFLPGVSPQRPVSFELGAFQAPPGFHLLIFDIRPDIYRLSGSAAGDTVPVEARRFSTIVGFELTIDQRHTGNTAFQLDPIAIQSGMQEAFTGPVFPQNVVSGEGAPSGIGVSRFNIGASSSFAAASGAGLQLMPQRATRYGPLNTPFCLYVKQNQTVQIRGVVFRPIPTPLAFFEYDIAGFLLPETWVDSMAKCLRPLTNASGGPGSLGGGGR